MIGDSYGKETVVDLDKCDVALFNRADIERYFVELCDLIDMQREMLCWWDDIDVAEEDKCAESHTKGTSAVQFILTSNVTLHSLELLEKVMVNIFSCKDYNEVKAVEFTVQFFGGTLKRSETFPRG